MAGAARHVTPVPARPTRALARAGPVAVPRRSPGLLHRRWRGMNRCGAGRLQSCAVSFGWLYGPAAAAGAGRDADQAPRRTFRPIFGGWIGPYLGVVEPAVAKPVVVPVILLAPTCTVIYIHTYIHTYIHIILSIWDVKTR